VERSLGTERLIARLLTAFALLSVALASVGLYGVLGYSVERRTNEIGLRLALGATRGGVMRGILRQAAAMVLAGSAIGAPAALLLSRLLGGLLYGVTPANPVVLASSIGILLAVAVASAAAPAWRAARVDPLVALRHE
jgi:ABC-type antimicrobial peptide transport system permease subunit